MKRLALYISLSCIIISCKNKDTKTDSNNSAIDTPISKHQPKVVNDTTPSSNIVTTEHYTISDISKDEYDKASNKTNEEPLYKDYHRFTNPYEADSALLKEYSNIVKRNKNQTTIVTKAGVKTFTNLITKGNTSLDTKDSSFLLVAISNEFSILWISYYESGAYKLVDLTSGQSLNIWGKAYPSISKQQILSANIDLDARFEANGIQLVTMENGQWKIKWEEELNDWGMENPIWVDEKTIYFIEEKMNVKGGNEHARNYKKMILL